MGVKVIRKTAIIASRDEPSISPGNYAVSNLETRPWIFTPVTVSRPKTRRAKPEQVIVNSIFKECAELTQDTTWKTIFNSASYGKLPKGFTFKDGFLTHKIRNKLSRVEISSNAAQAFEECTSFFKTKAGIMSEEDQKKAREEFEDFLLESGSLYPTRWTEVRKKVRDVLISTFVGNVAKEVGLRPAEKADMKNKINLGLILGCFGNDQIVLENGYIKEIAGLEFDHTSRNFKIDHTKAPKQLKKSRRVEKEKLPKKSFYALWVKFLDTLEKRVTKTGHFAAPLTPSSNDCIGDEEDFTELSPVDEI